MKTRGYELQAQHTFSAFKSATNWDSEVGQLVFANNKTDYRIEVTKHKTVKGRDDGLLQLASSNFGGTTNTITLTDSKSNNVLARWHVAGCHLASRSQQQRWQQSRDLDRAMHGDPAVPLLWEQIMQQAAPVIIAGDLNQRDKLENDEYRRATLEQDHSAAFTTAEIRSAATETYGGDANRKTTGLSATSKDPKRKDVTIGGCLDLVASPEPATTIFFAEQSFISSDHQPAGARFTAAQNEHQRTLDYIANIVAHTDEQLAKDIREIRPEQLNDTLQSNLADIFHFYRNLRYLRIELMDRFPQLRETSTSAAPQDTATVAADKDKAAITVLRTFLNTIKTKASKHFSTTISRDFTQSGNVELQKDSFEIEIKELCAKTINNDAIKQHRHDGSWFSKIVRLFLNLFFRPKTKTVKRVSSCQAAIFNKKRATQSVPATPASTPPPQGNSRRNTY